MLYILPFVGLDGKEYILRGDKHMPGDECRDLAQQTTTLYVHVLDGGEGEDATVVSSGIVRIDGSGIIDLILSLEVYCENEDSCGVAPRVQGLLAWGSILLADVLENCLGFVPELPDRDLPLPQVSIQFEEYIAGYAAVGGELGMDVGDYQDFYDRGVENGDAIAFDITVSIDNTDMWAEDPLHRAAISGLVFVDGLTPADGAHALGYLDIFPNGAGGVYEGELTMIYVMSFLGSNGKRHTLYADKHIPGEGECDAQDYITLYCHVMEDGEFEPTWLSSGMMSLDGEGIIDLVRSLEVECVDPTIECRSVLRKLPGVLQFATTLVADVLENCLGFTLPDDFEPATRSDFWYLWASDGTNALLLDIIERADSAELRLAIWDVDSSPVLLREIFPLEKLKIHPDGGVEIEGQFVYNDRECKGTVEGVVIDLQYDLSGRGNSFVPPALEDTIVEQLIPTVTSRYATTTSITGDVPILRGVPVVLTRYDVPFLMNVFQWTLSSTSNYVNEDDGSDTDLEIEVVAMPLGGVFLGFAYVMLDGVEYHMNGLIGDNVRIATDGSEVVNGERCMVAQIVLEKDPEGSLGSCFAENECLSGVDLEAPIEDRESLGICLMQNECIIPNPDPEALVPIELETLLSCVVVCFLPTSINQLQTSPSSLCDAFPSLVMNSSTFSHPSLLTCRDW
jgi:hypothetical protein